MTRYWRNGRTILGVLAGVATLGLLATPANAAPTAQDVLFLQQAHQANLAEISAGQLAQQRSDNAAIKQIGATFVANHTTLDSAVQQTAHALGVTLPATPNAEQQAAAAHLKQVSGAAFDKLYVAAELDGHHDAMADVQTELAKGTDAQVKADAQAAEPVIAKHLQMLQAEATQLSLPTPSYS
jgi:putative membrane protein